MNISRNTTTAQRLKDCVLLSIPQGTKTALWLLKLTIPVSFLVFLLDHFGVLNLIAGWVAPLFKLIGLSGQASVILITSFFTNIYSVIAVMTTLGTGYREGTILAVMCLISHALIVETAIQRRTGSKAWHMVLVRLSASFLAAFILNLVLPAEPEQLQRRAENVAPEFVPAFLNWLSGISVTTVKILVLVNLLLIVQRVLNEFEMIRWILKPFQPLLKLFGLPKSTGFLLIVAYTLGLGYGGAIMINEAEEGRLSAGDADLLNYHIAISHSQFEDTLLFVAVGFPVLVMMLPRILIAMVYVWARRLAIGYRKQTFI